MHYSSLSDITCFTQKNSCTLLLLLLYISIFQISKCKSVLFIIILYIIVVFLWKKNYNSGVLANLLNTIYCGVLSLMATEEILKLCEALSLSEEDGPILDIAGDVQADVGPGVISQLKFKFSEFWIHIYNIPLACMNCKVARLIAEEVGTIVDFSIDSKDLWGKFLRIKVSIDITKPLKRGIRLRLANFDTMITALIKYERLPDFCYGCRFIGHSFRECYNSEVRKNIMEGVEPKFGGWLRASPLDRSKFRQKGEDTSEAILKAQEDIEHVAGVGAKGASRSLSTIPTSFDKRGGKSSRDLGVSEPNRALIAADGISTQII
ncbi:hypothetical protein ACOSQ3_027801 [Xanthoceras sorbifolium]